MSTNESFNELIKKLKPLRLSAWQWAQLNRAVVLDAESEEWVSKNPDDIADELLEQATRVAGCLREIDRDEMPYMGATIGADDQPSWGKA
jgi:hypothetical protein